MPTRLLLSLLTLLFLSTALLAQEGTNAAADDRKIVALMSTKKSFFPDYTVDSLVKHMNIFNENPDLRYVRCTEDDTRTGFYADYVIDIHFEIRPPHLDRPRPALSTKRRLPAEEAVVVNQRDADGIIREKVQMRQVVRDRSEPAQLVPGKGEVQVKILEKSRNEKVVKRYLQAQSDDEKELKFELIVSLMNFLMRRYNPK